MENSITGLTPSPTPLSKKKGKKNSIDILLVYTSSLYDKDIVLVARLRTIDCLDVLPIDPPHREMVRSTKKHTFLSASRSLLLSC